MKVLSLLLSGQLELAKFDKHLLMLIIIVRSHSLSSAFSTVLQTLDLFKWSCRVAGPEDASRRQDTSISSVTLLCMVCFHLHTTEFRIVLCTVLKTTVMSTVLVPSELFTFCVSRITSNAVFSHLYFERQQAIKWCRKYSLVHFSRFSLRFCVISIHFEIEMGHPLIRSLKKASLSTVKRCPYKPQNKTCLNFL